VPALVRSARSLREVTTGMAFAPALVRDARSLREVTERRRLASREAERSEADVQPCAAGGGKKRSARTPTWLRQDLSSEALAKEEVTVGLEPFRAGTGKPAANGREAPEDPPRIS
jgi:hypothetical protein